MTTQFETSTYAAPATSIAYDVGPDNGPPAVFFHSLGTRRQDWAAVLPELAADHQVYAVDLRGHGDSGRVSGGYRFTQYAEDIVPFLRDVVGRPAALIGHSLGGVVATVTAVNNPELATTLVAADPPLFTKRRAPDDGNPSRYLDRFKRARDLAASGMTETQLFEMLRERSPDRPEQVSKALAANLAKLDPDVFTPALNGGQQFDFEPEDLVGRLTTPMLLVQAAPAKGAAVREEDAIWATEQNSLISRVVIEGSAHEIHHSHREQFVETVRDFIARK